MVDCQELKQELAQTSDFLIALGDEKRQAIIVKLLEDQACNGLQVGDLTEATGLSRPAVSHQLKVLRDAGMIDFRSEGTRNYYYLVRETHKLDQLRHLLDAVAEKIGDMPK